ncbi:MAG: PorP/SprF family type IX secretion system membrane protein [Bacteroidota bacterium]
MKNQPHYSSGNLTGKLKKAGLAAVLLLGTALSSQAQLNPFQAMYFQNQYQYNPAMAGLNKGLNINLGYRQQWSNFPGTPKTGSFTADLQAADKVGLGINVNDEQTGLIRSTRVMGTYAYHLPLNGGDQKLSFGLSLGLNDSRVNYANINGDQGDQEVAQYNQLKPYVDGDFGFAYTSDKLSVGGALPNLKSAFFKTSDSRFDADRMVFIATTSYKFLLPGDGKGFILEPLAAYRIVKGYKDIIDGGLNFTLNDYGLYFQSIYHSSQSMGLGAGLDQQTYAFSFSYNLETGQLASYTHGAFEFGLKLRLFGK